MAGLNEQGGAELRCRRGESTRESMMRTAVAQGVSQEARRLGWTSAARPRQGLTVGALEAVRALDLGVPQELSIVCFNDSATLGWWGNGVTSIGLPVFDIAVACASGLLGTLARNPSAAVGAAWQPSRAAFAPFLVERGSTARVAPRTARHGTAWHGPREPAPGRQLERRPP